MREGDVKSHIKWCFSRNQVELEEPNSVLAGDYLEKAEEALEVAALLEENGFYSWTVTAAYYARYFALTALLRRCGITCENHSCSISIFALLFVGSGEMDSGLLSSIKGGKRNRVEKHYGIVEVTEREASTHREEAIEFVRELRVYTQDIVEEQAVEFRDELAEIQRAS